MYPVRSTPIRRISSPRRSAGKNLARMIVLLFASLLSTNIALGQPWYVNDSLLSEIKNLRARGRYSEAAETARARLAGFEADSSREEWMIADARRLAATLEYAMTLPEKAQANLAEVDALASTIEEHGIRMDCESGEEAALRQMEIRRKILGEDHLETVECLAALIVFHSCRGDFSGARELAEKALETSRNEVGDEHPMVAGLLSDLSMLELAEGDYEKAVSLSREALGLYTDLVGEGDPGYLTILNNYGTALAYQGDFATAEPVLRKALAKRRELLGEESYDVAVAAINLGALLDMRGDDYEGEELYREALEILERIQGENGLDFASCLGNLGVLLVEQGDYEQAGPVLERVLRIQRESFGENHPDVALALMNVGAVHRMTGNLERAERCFREAHDMRERLSGSFHPETVKVLFNLACCLMDKGEYTQADSLCRIALERREACLGREHPEMVLTGSTLGRLRRIQGDILAAEDFLAHACEAFEAGRLRAGRGIERATFAVSPYEELAAVLVGLGKTDEAWEAVERSRGRVLADLLMVVDQRPLAAEEKAIEDSLLNDLGALQDMLAACYDRAARDSSDSWDREARAIRTRLLRAEASLAEHRQALSLKYPALEGGSFDRSRVQASLRPGTAIVGWLEDPWPGPDSLGAAWAYVVRDQGDVKWFPMENIGKTDRRERIRNYRDRIRSTRGPFARGPDLVEESTRLYRERFTPIEPALSGVDRLVIVPSREMIGVPVETLVDTEGRYLCDRFEILYAPSATVFAWIAEHAKADRDRRRQKLRALFVGDAPYREEHLAWVSPSSRDPMRSPAPEHEAGSDSTWQSDRELAEGVRGGRAEALMALPRLLGSRREVESSGCLFGDRVDVLLGIDASEQSLLDWSGRLDRYSVIHLSAHVVMDNRRPENSALILSQVGLPDPFDRARKGERILDGRWTAREVLREWRLAADLVVLSACETALGQEVPGEGYVGFSQAFLLAGARNLVVSLWEVDDASTSLLMESFYRHLLDTETSGDARAVPEPAITGSAVASALRRAKQVVRDFGTHDSKRLYADPWYWAGFIQVGSYE